MTEQDKIMQELRRINDSLEDAVEDLRVKNAWLTEQLAKREDLSEKIELYKKAIAKYGAKAQTVVAMEEMAELIKELSKAFRGYGNPDAIIEEMADVYIMLDQLKLIFGITGGEIKAMEMIKNNRLEDRLSNAK